MLLGLFHLAAMRDGVAMPRGVGLLHAPFGGEVEAAERGVGVGGFGGGGGAEGGRERVWVGDEGVVSGERTKQKKAMKCRDTCRFTLQNYDYSSRPKVVLGGNERFDC